MVVMVPTPRTPKGQMRLCLFGGITLLVLGALIALASAVFVDTGAVDIASLPASEISSAHNYRIDELYVLDCYAQEDTDAAYPTLYMVVGYGDANDELCYSSLVVAPGSALYEDVNKYMNDSSLGYGDYTVSGYFVATSLTDTSQLSLFDDEAKSMNDEVVEGNIVRIDLVYRAGNAAAFAEYIRGEEMATLIPALVLAGVGVLLIVLYAGMRKKYSPQGYAPVYGQPVQPVMNPQGYAPQAAPVYGQPVPQPAQAADEPRV